jgi:hypothetical protein
MTDELEFRIGKLELKDGDVLVVKIDGFVTDDTSECVTSYVKGKLPAGVQVLVVPGGVDLSVLSLEEITDRTRITPA